MKIIYSRREIAELMQERKELPNDWRSLLYKNGNLDVDGDAGNEFRIIARQNPIRPLDFSVILVVIIPGSYDDFKLRRYNGWTNPHRNRIEGNEVNGFHIHFATERYQKIGYKEETYAEETDRYSDFEGALRCLIKDANFVLPPQAELF